MTPSPIAKCFWVRYSNPDMLSELWSVVGPGPWIIILDIFVCLCAARWGCTYMLSWYTLNIIAPLPNSWSFWGLLIVDNGMKEGNSPTCQAQCSTSPIINSNIILIQNLALSLVWYLVWIIWSLLEGKKKEGKELTLLWLYDSAKLKALYKLSENQLAGSSWCVLSKFRGCIGIYSFTSS